MKTYQVVCCVAERKHTLKTIDWALSTFKRVIVNIKSTRRLLRNCNVAWRGNTGAWGWWTHANWRGKSFWDAQVVWTVLLCVDAVHAKTAQASTSVFETPPCKIVFSSFLNITKNVSQPHQIFPSCSSFFCTSFSAFLSIICFGLRAIHTILFIQPINIKMYTTLMMSQVCLRVGLQVLFISLTVCSPKGRKLCRCF